MKLSKKKEKLIFTIIEYNNDLATDKKNVKSINFYKQIEFRIFRRKIFSIYYYASRY